MDRSALEMENEDEGPAVERKLTEKGRLYVAEMRWQDCFRLQKKITTKINLVDKLTATTEKRSAVEAHMEDLMLLFRKIPEVQQAWLSKLEEEEQKAYAVAWLDEQTRRVREFEIEISEWLANAKSEDLKEVRSTTSKSSRRSTRTYRSLRSTESARARERAKAAELMAKVSFLEKKQALRNQAEKLELEEQLSIAQAKEQTYAELEDEEFPDRIQILEEIPPPVLPSASEEQRILLDPEPAVEARPLSFDAPSFTPARVIPTTHSNVEELIKKQGELTEMIAIQQQQTLLPPLVLTKFLGDPMEYHGFMSTFEAQIEGRLSSPDARLRYLEQYLDGEPRELIRSCVHSGPMGYYEAKELLSERYGDPYIISNAYIRKVTEWPVIGNNDTKSLEQFGTFLTRCKIAIGSLSYLNVLNHPHNIQCLVTKLPYFLQDRWRRD